MKLVNEARQAFHDPDVRILGADGYGTWTGDLTHSAVLQGAQSLDDMVAGHAFGQDEKLNVIGHSRGGDVALDASIGISHKIDNLITPDAPAHADLDPDLANIGTWINVSVNQDWVMGFNSDWGTSPRQRSGAFNLRLNAPQYGPIASHSAVWQDNSLRSQ